MSRLAQGLREIVSRANRELFESGLAIGTFGNVSGIDRELGLMVIKPSGVPYPDLTPPLMVPVSLSTGEVVDSDCRPSSDAPTHLALYRAFSCGGIAHTHSEYATSFAQAGLPIRCMGTTHADHFRGDIPVTRVLTREEVNHDYEKNTGRLIVETFQAEDIAPDQIPAVLVAHHGPFTWGQDALGAVENARILEKLARMELWVRLLTPQANRPPSFLIEKHHQRKHGKDASYGQR